MKAFSTAVSCAFRRTQHRLWDMYSRRYIYIYIWINQASTRKIKKYLLNFYIVAAYIVHWRAVTWRYVNMITDHRHLVSESQDFNFAHGSIEGSTLRGTVHNGIEGSRKDNTVISYSIKQANDLSPLVYYINSQGIDLCFNLWRRRCFDPHNTFNIWCSAPTQLAWGTKHLTSFTRVDFARSMFVRRFVLRVLRCQRKGKANMPRCQRRGLKPRWRRVVVFSLGIIGRGYTGAPPHLPRGWTTHYHQGTPYFYNEYTGETTWDQPVPSPEETRDEQGSNSGRIGHLLPGDQPRKISPTVEYSRNSGIPTSKRGWFGFGRGAAKPRQQEETPIRLETRGTARNPTDMNDYKPTRDRDARRSPPREWPSDRGGKEMMPRQQGGPEGPGSRFGNGRIPAYDLRQNPPGSSTRAWGGEDGGVAAQPWDDHAEHVKVQPSGTAMGGGIDRDRQMRDINESPAAALSAGHPGVVEGFNLEAVGPAISGDSERWMGDTTTIGAAVTDDVEPKAGNVGGLQGDTETSSGHVGISGEISYNETSITLERGRETDSMGTGTQEPKLQPHTKSTEGFGEGTTTLDATAMITDTEKAVATAGEQTSSLLAEEESPRDNEVSTPWEPEMTRTYAVNERQQDRSSAPEGEHHMAFFGNVGGYYPTEAWSGGKPGTTHGEDGSHWGDGFPPPERVKSPRQDAGCWDWSDPWGQEGAWDAPAWGVGTAGTQPHHKDEVVPTSNTRSQGAGNFPAHPTGEERDRDGWGVSIDQTRVGGQSSGQMTSNDVMAAATRRKELEELACALTETRKELEDARNVEEGLRSALCEQERAAIKATAAAVSAGEKAERAEALVRKREEDAKENSTAVGQWLVTLGIEQQELKGQLAAAVSNSTLLAQELGTLRQTAREAELRANTSEAKLKMALEDVEVLDEGLKQYMDGDGRRISPRPSRDIWKRVSEAYLRPLLPSKLKSPSPEELEAAKLERSLGRALENNSALAEAVKSKDEFVRDLNSRIDQFQLQAVRRRKGYRALKIGLADLTHEVQTKESMVIVLVVVMVQTASTLEGIYAVICAQREAFDCLASLSRDQENEVQSLALEVENGAARVAHLQEAVDRADSALSAIAASLGAGEACVQRWKDAFDQESSTASREDSLLELLRELHAAAACKFTNPLGLEPTTGAMTVAVPRMVTDQIDIDTKMPSRKRTFWGLFLDILCCRRRE